MKLTKFVTLKLLLGGSFLFTDCSSMKIHNPYPDRPLVLETSHQTCTDERSFKQWYFLYGNSQINEISSGELFPTHEYTYRLREEVTVGDAILTILGGLFTTTTRKTIIVEKCQKNNYFTKEELGIKKGIALNEETQEEEISRPSTIKPEKIPEERKTNDDYSVNYDKMIRDLVASSENVVVYSPQNIISVQKNKKKGEVESNPAILDSDKENTYAKGRYVEAGEEVNIKKTIQEEIKNQLSQLNQPRKEETSVKLVEVFDDYKPRIKKYSNKKRKTQKHKKVLSTYNRTHLPHTCDCKNQQFLN